MNDNVDTFRPGVRHGLTRRRLITAAAHAAGAGVLAAACAPGQATDSGGAGGPVRAPAQPTRVEVWHGWSGARMPLVQQIFDKLMEQHPTLKIEPVLQGVNSEPGMTRLIAAVTGGAPPDALMIYQDLIPRFGPSTQLLAPVDEYMRRDGVKRDIFYEADIGACMAAGKTWMLPHVLPNTYTGLFYNKAITERAGIDFDKNHPATWAELEAAASRLSTPHAATPTLGFVIDVGTNRIAEAWWGTQALAAFSADGRKATFAEPAAVAVVEWMVQTRARLSPPSALEAVLSGAAVNHSTLTGAFLAGRLALHQNAFYSGFGISQSHPDLRWGVMPIMPRTRGQKMALPHKDAWGYGMTEGSKAKDAAWLVVKRMTADEEGGGWLMVQQGRPSPLKNVNDSPEQRRNNPYYDVFKRLLESRWTRPAGFVPPEATRIYTEALTQIASGTQAPRTALQEAATRVQAILDRESPPVK